jgi:hypothetical protein
MHVPKAVLAVESTHEMTSRDSMRDARSATRLCSGPRCRCGPEPDPTETGPGREDLDAKGDGAERVILASGASRSARSRSSSCSSTVALTRRSDPSLSPVADRQLEDHAVFNGSAFPGVGWVKATNLGLHVGVGPHAGWAGWFA